MELEQLRHFTAAAEAGSFSAAARSLYISHSTICRSVSALEAGESLEDAVARRLEEELGVRLFERSSRDFRLTEAGEALLPQAQSLLDAAEKIKDGMKNARPAN